MLPQNSNTSGKPGDSPKPGRVAFRCGLGGSISLIWFVQGCSERAPNSAGASPALGILCRNNPFPRYGLAAGTRARPSSRVMLRNTTCEPVASLFS